MDIAFDQTLRTYADLTVKIGLNLEPNQRLLISARLRTAASRSAS